MATVANSLICVDSIVNALMCVCVSSLVFFFVFSNVS